MVRTDMSDNQDMSESDESDDSIDRRRFMSALGAAGGAAALAAVSGEASAESGGALGKTDVDIEKVDGNRAENMIRKVQRQESYEILSDYLESEKGTVVDDSNAEVYSCQDPDEPGIAYLCSLPLATTEGESIERAGISVELRQGRIKSMSASRAEQVGEMVYDVTLQMVSDGEVQESTMTVDAAEMAAKV